MPEAKQQTQSSTGTERGGTEQGGTERGGTERSLSRRPEYFPSQDIFTPFASFSPFALMRRFSEEMDRTFGNVFGGGRETGAWAGWSPAIEVRQTDGNMEITAELPGMTKDDVKIECTDEAIIIEGEKRQEHEENRGGIRRSERSYGHFYRMVPLPQGAAADKAKAEFKDGVLQVRVPVPENKQQRRQIPIAT
jgi:HSP20 family protein